MNKNILKFVTDYCGYIFPLILLLLLVTLSFLRISGTSIGVYDTFFNGKNNSDLIHGEPRGVRSDEWLVATQLSVAQAASGFPRFNTNFGEPKDMSLVVDVPYKEWSAAFKPQNFSFFIMPLENAFAFKWWFLLVSLLISLYALVLRFLPKRYLVATLISIIGGTGPFIAWWYQSITIMPIVWGILLALLALRIIDNRPFHFLRKRPRPLLLTNGLLATAFTYSAVSFALVLYPAFQIPLLFCFAALIIGFFFNNLPRLKREKAVQYVLYSLGAGGATALIIIGLFVATRLSAFDAMSNTIYPGKRDVSSGKTSSSTLLYYNGYSQYGLASDKATTLPLNQSASSTFLVISIIFIGPLLLLLYRYYTKKRSVEWVLLAAIIVNLIFLAHQFVPLFTPLAKLLLLSLVPQQRLVMGYGILAIITINYLLHLRKSTPEIFSGFRLKSRLFLFYGAGFTGIFLFLAFLIDRDFPLFAANTKLLVAMSLLFSGASLLLLTRRYLIGLIILAGMTLAISYPINPLYRGLGFATQGGLVDAVRTTSTPSDVWAVTNNFTLEDIPFMADRKSIGGTQFYPDKALWSDIAGRSFSQVYNRYAHIIFVPGQKVALHLVQSDYFQVRLDCTSSVSAPITKVLSTTKLGLSCFTLTKSLSYPNQTVYLYSRK